LLKVALVHHLLHHREELLLVDHLVVVFVSEVGELLCAHLQFNVCVLRKALETLLDLHIVQFPVPQLVERVKQLVALTTLFALIRLYARTCPHSFVN